MTLSKALRFSLVFVSFLAGSLVGAPVQAQMVLPGAVGAPPPGTPDQPGGAAGAPKPAKPKPVAPKFPSEESLVGKELLLRGKSGRLSFERKDKDLRISRLSLEGDLISKPGEACQVDLGAAGPISLKPAGRPNGLVRFEVEAAACPFGFDIVDGAIFASHTGQACTFTAADCKVDPTGLWGPAGNTIGPERAKEIERGRASSETTLRTNFKALISSTGKDRASIKALAREQAAFSSQREEICRDYARETAHGYCAWRYTEARSFGLRARLKGGKIDEAGDAPKPVRKKPRPKPPVAPAAGGPMMLGPPQ